MMSRRRLGRNRATSIRKLTPRGKADWTGLPENDCEILLTRSPTFIGISSFVVRCHSYRRAGFAPNRGESEPVRRERAATAHPSSAKNYAASSLVNREVSKPPRSRTALCRKNVDEPIRAPCLSIHKKG